MHTANTRHAHNNQLQVGEQHSMSFECAPYSDAELHEFLHVLRPVILQKEATSFNNVAALLGRRFASRAFADHMKVIRRVFEHGELNLYMQVSIGGQPLFHESLLDTWLNGAASRANAEKAEAWRALEKSLSTPNARAVVIVSSKARSRHSSTSSTSSLSFWARAMTPNPSIERTATGKPASATYMSKREASQMPPPISTESSHQPRRTSGGDFPAPSTSA